MSDGADHDYGYRGEFGESWMHVLASAAGLTYKPHQPDRDGWDCTLTMKKATKAGYKVDVSASFQVKTFQGDKGKGDSFTFNRMTVAQHNMIASGGHAHDPGYVIVVCVPPLNVPFTEQTGEGLLLKYRAHYYRIDTCERADGHPQSAVSLEIPRRQLVTQHNIRDLVEAEVPIGPRYLEEVPGR
ncbi:hypothetical protein [Salininema proteolyticum]|uniref:DUF4365 domain-containing protein n=1 Tax=Salininema proteolyticum TaxID=1607685 RepID=A0ABV8U3L4_9ACTN